MFRKYILIITLAVIALSFQACSLIKSNSESPNPKPAEEVKTPIPSDTVVANPSVSIDTLKQGTVMDSTKNSDHQGIEDEATVDLNQTDSQYKRITFDDQKQVEQLIKEYFAALEKRDYSAAWNLMSPESKNSYPLSEALKSHFGVDSIKLVSMQGYLPPCLSSTGEVPPNTPTIWFDVKLDIKPSENSAWDDGVNERFVRVKKDGNGVWKFDGLATSP